MRAVDLFRPGRWLLPAMVAIAGGYPLVRLLLVPLFPALAPPQIASAGDDALSLAAIGNSVRIGAEVGVAALIPGFLIGYALERLEWGGARLLGAAVWALLITPSFLLCTGWQLFVAMALLSATPMYGLLFSEAGIVLLLTLKALPFAALTARAAWATVAGEIGWAARIHVRSPGRRAAIVARLLSPAIGAVVAVGFVEGIADFGVAATLGAHLRMPLMIYGVYAALARTPIDFRRAATLSLVLMLFAAAAVMAQQWLVTRHVGPAGRSRPEPPHHPSRLAARAAALGTVALLVLAFVVPAMGLGARAFAASASAGPADARWPSLGYSVCYAFVAATMSVAIAATLLAGRSAADTGFARLVDVALLCSLAVPGIVLGAGYVIAFNGWLPLYGTPSLLLLGLVATHLPLQVRFLQGPFASLSAGLADAATLHGMRRRDRLELVHIPLMLRPMLWSWALAFGGVFFELPLASLLYPVGRAPIGVELLSLDETLRFADEARLALAGIAVCAVVVTLVVVVLPRWLSSRVDASPAALAAASL